MTSRCINCGGQLSYDIASAKVKCLHCDSEFDPESFKIKTAAEEYKDEQNSTPEYAATMFVCPNCGAEIYSTELDAVNYCLYCGSFVTLESQLARIKRPQYIIPFAKTMEECKTAYKKLVRSQLYAPSDFRDEKFIEGFKGIYIPFWNFEYQYGPHIDLEGKEESRDGDYVITQYYHINCEASGNIDNVAYDASSTFDDEISLRVAPYKKADMKKFNPSYMFGFFGDTADIEASVYQQASDEDVKEQLWESLTNAKGVDKGHPSESVPEGFEKNINLQKKSSLALLPVWFLTWRKDDRVAYSVMNGSNGNMYAEIPVSPIRYLLFSLLTAIPIFFCLNEFVTFTAREMLTISMCLAFFMCMLYVSELDRIVRRVMHTDDRGFLETHAHAKLESDKHVDSNAITEILSFFGELTIGGWFYALLAFIVFCIGAPEMVAIGLLVAIVGVPIYTFCRLRSNAKLLKEKSKQNVWLDIAGAIFSIVLGAGLLIYDPAPDETYYFASMLCMLGVGLAALRMVVRYNQFITRPVPRFFNRREGGK